jgi:signal transduction histidine kinase
VSGYYPWLDVLLNSFSAITFTLLSFLWLQEYRKRGSHWGGYLYLYITAACAILFVSNLVNYLSWGMVYYGQPFLVYPQIAASALLPGWLLHFFYRNEKEGLPGRRIWQGGLFAVYALGFLFAALALGALGRPNQDYLGDRRTLLAFRALMVTAATGCGLVLWVSRRPGTDRLWRNQRRWLLLLCGAWMCIYLMGSRNSWISVIEKPLPLGFGFVITYYAERTTFFDVLIKKGAFTFCFLLILAAYFLVMAPFLLRLWWGTRTAVLAWALLVLPIVLVAPWGQRKLSVWLDRLFLGRRFLPAQASKYFLTGLQSAIGESELVERAERLLEEIFQSEAKVQLDPGPFPAAGSARGCMEAAIRSDGERTGLISIQPRVHGSRFLSEDVTLLSSLAETYSFLLDNLRLREERAQRKRREQDLLLEAERSELRALRAQVNPHFMFNALNTIAGLIPRRPDRAERTIEQLAEVFRYTLRRSEREWVPLDEELEAVRAYLDIERTRFGDRLEFTIRAGDEADEVRIPAMIVQTLVENAVKHGVGATRVPGRIEVNVDVTQSRLRIEVRDNGPGFEESALRVFDQPGEGHGLRNVRERLRGYFGDAACLSVARDGSPGMTVVSVEMPRTTRPVEVAP